MKFNFKLQENEVCLNNLVKKLNLEGLDTKLQELTKEVFVLTVNKVDFFITEDNISTIGNGPTPLDPAHYYRLSIRRRGEEIENIATDKQWDIFNLPDNDKIELYLKIIKESIKG